MFDKMYICTITVHSLVFIVGVLFKILNINGHPIDGNKCIESTGNYIYCYLVIIVRSHKTVKSKFNEKYNIFIFTDPISTHILETSLGLPGDGIDVHLFKLLPGANWVFVSSRFV